MQIPHVHKQWRCRGDSKTQRHARGYTRHPAYQQYSNWTRQENDSRRRIPPQQGRNGCMCQRNIQTPHTNHPTPGKKCQRSGPNMYHRNPHHPPNPEENHTETSETTAEIAGRVIGHGASTIMRIRAKHQVQITTIKEGNKRKFQIEGHRQNAQSKTGNKSNHIRDNQKGQKQSTERHETPQIQDSVQVLQRWVLRDGQTVPPGVQAGWGEMATASIKPTKKAKKKQGIWRRQWPRTINDEKDNGTGKENQKEIG